MFRRPNPDPEVLPQLLSSEGSRIEKALAMYRKDVNPPYFTTGHVDEHPSLKIIIKSEDVTFQHPYARVEELYHIAEQSQVGTAKKTLFRFDARQSKEFSSIEVLNQSWIDKVTSVCDNIREVLAPGASKVNAELYKLLIYREGDFFRQHQDAQHSDRMFATLLFFLPVKYTAGEFEVFRPGSYDREVVEDKRMSNGCSWVAFYTDVRHEVAKVTGGFRVVLNYCLSFEGVMSPSPVLPGMSPSAAGTVDSYFKAFPQKAFAIPLSYQYTQATLSPDFLKGIDAYVFNAIEKVASPELHFVLRFDKTKVIPPAYASYGYGVDYFDLDSGHEQVFQGIFLVEHETAKKYLEIESESEQQLSELSEIVDQKFPGQRLKRFPGYSLQGERKDEYSALMDKMEACRTKRADEYLVLMKKVKASQENFNLEWIVKRRESGEPIDGFSELHFEYGKVGWLGNMTPAEEYYYLQAAIVVRLKK